MLYINIKYYCCSDDQEVLDESPMKVGSELISMAIDPQLPGHLRVPVTVSLQNTNVCNSVCIYCNNIRIDFDKTRRPSIQLQ